jgi:hypothetical protein
MTFLIYLTFTIGETFAYKIQTKIYVEFYKYKLDPCDNHIR